MSDTCSMNIDQYTIDEYYKDLEQYGLDGTWNAIIRAFQSGQKPAGIVSVQNIGELYEIGLAKVNKISKKEQGKYYTPDDVANVMAEWLLPLRGTNVADVCCGTGNLIIAYLEKLGKTEACSLISNGHLYLYDQDDIALRICQTTLGTIYGMDIVSNIHIVSGDFLEQKVVLPNDCKVISNPPYFHIIEIKEEWNNTKVVSSTKEFYSAILEKILDQSEAAVIITPYSFIGGTKFFPLRQKMNEHSGFIVAFDNVPGNIFSGRKHGIFNTNNTNSVRAAITVIENNPDVYGFRCSNLIRFKTDERADILKTSVLESFVSKKYQVVDNTNDKYVKCLSSLEPVLEAWNKAADGHTVKEHYDNTGQYELCVPNTCRYFSVAASRDLKRTGKINIKISNQDVYDYLYCLLNSSFCYWHWRLYDGGITYAKTLLNNLPDIYHMLNDNQKKQLSDIANEMRTKEEEYLSYKKNAGELQENIKFPDLYRQKINNVLLLALNIKEDSNIFNPIHSNHIFERNDNE